MFGVRYRSPSLRSAHPNRVRGGALEDEPAASRPFCLFGQASRRQAGFPQTLHEMFEIIRCRIPFAQFFMGREVGF